MKLLNLYLFIFLLFFVSCSSHKETTKDLSEKNKEEIRITLNDNVVFKNLGQKINTEYNEFGSAITGNGKILYFTSNRPNRFSEKGDEDIWYSVKEGEEWGLPKNLGFPINDKGSQATTAIQPDGQFVYFALSERKDGYGDCDLYYSRLEGLRWTEPINLGPVVNSPYWDHHPTISSDGRTLIFASNRPGGYGNSDLWITFKDNEGNWSKPQNLGPNINTSGQEMSPFLSLDNKTLYFSSNSGPGVGGFDIFVSQYNNGVWSLRKNIGEPYNSPEDEYFITIPAANDTAYICSNREGAIQNSLDIWLAVPPPIKSITFQPVVVAVTGIVSEFNSKPLKPIGATLTIKDLKNDSTIAQFMSNSATGEYYIILTRGRNYGITAKAPGYLFYSNQFEIPADAKYQELRKDIQLFPLKSPGTTGDKPSVRLMVFFDFDKATLRPESFTDLNNAIEFLKANPQVYVEIAGHTDKRGTDEYNDKLSQDRAESVASYIVVNGKIDPARVKPVGYGKRKLLFQGDTEEIHQANRRVEMVLIKY
ncbi:MAG TPA: OmpA family protein [Bacteroidota bacterium]|jgi:outer membrane protein OmpA-like peptidoglycan-associated protein|nr:OmpA family protein [Bacteroidota bacterium]